MVKGYGLKNSLFNKIIDNTKAQYAADEIIDNKEKYYLDKDLSTRTIRIYYNPKKKVVVISHSSTISRMI